LELKENHMKILTPLSIAIVISLAGCSHIISTDKIKGSGIAKTEKRSVAPFTSLEVNCHGSIQVHAQRQEGLEISGDDNIIPLITTEVNNGTLYIRSSKEYDPRDKLEIIVSAPDLKKFVFSGAGEANLSNVKNDRMEIALNGAGSLTASGETKEADITLSGAGSVDAKNLHAINAKVNSTGVGIVDIYVMGQLDAKTSGVGEINYYGSPKSVNRQAGGLGGINER
jgi:Putative auto-transporter adhesin, head GIN domain